MKRLLALSVSAALALLATGAIAQTPSIDGEVTKLDKAASRVTLRHGGIRSLDMPPMAMNFRVRDPHLLDGVAIGDKVRFAADKVDGHYTVTALVKAP